MKTYLTRSEPVHRLDSTLCYWELNIWTLLGLVSSRFSSCAEMEFRFFKTDQNQPGWF